MAAMSAANEKLPTDGPLPDAVLRYADHDDGLLDVHLPQERSAPAVVLLLHGGFWKTAHDRKHTRVLARTLADAGHVVATPEYRRVGPGGSGGWPRTGDDVRRVAEQLPALLDGVGVDMGPLWTLGHSAGGHLGLWLAAVGVPVDRTIALAPVCDLREAIRRGLGSDAAQAFLGDLDREQALAEADPMTLLDERPSGEVRVVHGIDDDVVPVDLSRGLVQRHPWVELHEVPGDHFDVITPGTAAWEVLARQLR